MGGIARGNLNCRILLVKIGHMIDSDKRDIFEVCRSIRGGGKTNGAVVPDPSWQNNVSILCISFNKINQ